MTHTVKTPRGMQMDLSSVRNENKYDPAIVAQRDFTLKFLSDEMPKLGLKEEFGFTYCCMGASHHAWKINLG